MSRRRPSSPPTPSPAAPPPVPVEVASGLEAIRLHGGRDEELYLSAEGSFFEEAFVTDRIVTAEEASRFIKKIEALIRTSPEYKTYIGYLRSDLGMNRCSFLPNLDVTTDEVGLEMHHCPLNLFQVVEVVVNHRLTRGQPVTSLSVADEVMRMHFEDKIGLVPLSRSVHKLVHAGSVVVHPAMVHGDWVGFLRAYPDGVAEELIAALLRFVVVDEAVVAESAEKLDGSRVAPRLRDGVSVPSADELGLLLMAPAGT